MRQNFLCVHLQPTTTCKPFSPVRGRVRPNAFQLVCEDLMEYCGVSPSIVRIKGIANTYAKLAKEDRIRRLREDIVKPRLNSPLSCRLVSTRDWPKTKRDFW